MSTCLPSSPRPATSSASFVDVHSFDYIHQLEPGAPGSQGSTSSSTSSHRDAIDEFVAVSHQASPEPTLAQLQARCEPLFLSLLLPLGFMSYHQRP